eukprot:357985-Chlamydomonas_euryale.AAC.7
MHAGRCTCRQAGGQAGRHVCRHTSTDFSHPAHLHHMLPHVSSAYPACRPARPTRSVYAPAAVPRAMSAAALPLGADDALRDMHLAAVSDTPTVPSDQLHAHTNTAASGASASPVGTDAAADAASGWSGGGTVDVRAPRCDVRAYRAVQLPNGFRALLVSDPEAMFAAACVSVRAGYFDDPEEVRPVESACVGVGRTSLC